MTPRQEDVPTVVDPHLDRLDKENPCTQHSGMCANVSRNGRDIVTLFAMQKDTNDALSDIRDRLLGRPSWAVVTILGILVSVCCILGTTVISRNNVRQADPQLVSALADIAETQKTVIYLLSKDGQKP